MRRPGMARLVGASVLLFLAACSGSELRNGGELHYGLTLAPTGIDPHINASSELGIPLASVYDTLVFRDGDGFVPGLAERWEVSPDSLTYTFRLRRDVRFHDGTPFNAQSVKTNLERILDTANKSQKARFMISGVQSVTVVDEFTVRLDLAEPFAPLLDALSQVYLGMASPAALEKWGADYQFHQVGTGPFRFVEYAPADHLTLERNPDYAWAPSVYKNKTAQLDRIVFRFYTDPAARTPALLSGEADVMGEVLPRDAADLEARGGYTVYPVSIPGQPMQFFLNTKAAPTDDPLVRRAILLAADRQTIVTTVFGKYSPVAVGPLTASTWAAADVVPADAFDPESAAGLLDQAGWTDANGDGTREKDGVQMSLKIVFPSWGLTPQAATLLEAQFEDAGFSVELVQVPSFSALVEAQQSGAYHLISTNLAGTDPDLLRPYFRSDGMYNWSFVQDATLDGILDDAMRESSEAIRRDLYRQIQERIAGENLLLPIRDYVNLNVAADRVGGLRYSAQGWFPILIDVSLIK